MKKKQEDQQAVINYDQNLYENGWENEDVKNGLLLIGMNNADKSARDNQNQTINEILKEASYVREPTKPRYIGAKKLKQAVQKTAERVQPLSWDLQGDGADEDLEVVITKAVKEVLHRGGYDSTFTGPGGGIDKILKYGDFYRFMLQADKNKTAFPIKFMSVDSNNIWFSTNATSYRDGNKNVTKLVVLFKGTVNEFNQEFPEYADTVRHGLIPRAFSFKDLDQTATQRFQSEYAASDKMGNDQKQIEWAYMFDLTKRSYVLIAGADLSILEKKKGKSGKDKYPWVFTNLEGKEEAYIPLMNYMCLPAEEGNYHVGICAYTFDMCILFRRTFNQMAGSVEENTYPHTLINIPQGQENTFFNLIEVANQMREQGQTGYVPITYNPNNPAGNISNANPIRNGGDLNAAVSFTKIIEDEFRKCGIYLDEPVNPNTLATQIEYDASNALTLPKAIMKYNAPTVEFEIMVAIDMIKRYVKDDDKTPLVLDTTVDLPDGTYSIRGVPFTLGWLKQELSVRQWRVKVDPASGAVTNDSMLISLYNKILPNYQPGSPEQTAILKRLALITGVKVPAENPVQSQQMLKAGQGQPVPTEGPSSMPGGAPPPAPTAQQAAGLAPGLTPPVNQNK